MRVLSLTKQPEKDYEHEWGEMGWKAFGVLELTALPSTLQEH